MIFILPISKLSSRNRSCVDLYTNQICLVPRTKERVVGSTVFRIE